MHRHLLGVAATLAVGCGVALAEDHARAERGHRFAQANCAQCHGVEAGDTVSPAAAAPPFRTVAQMPSMTGRALTVWLQSPHPSMPMLIVPDGARADLIAYILSLKGQP